MELKLSSVMIAMREYGFIEIKTGRAATSSKTLCMPSPEYEYAIGECLTDRKKYIEVPAINCNVFLKEFLEMQNFDKTVLTQEFGYSDADIPLVCKRGDDGLPVYPTYTLGESYEILGIADMEREFSIYSASRLAGLARKWCHDNGYEVVEDFGKFIDTYA